MVILLASGAEIGQDLRDILDAYVSYGLDDRCHVTARRLLTFLEGGGYDADILAFEAAKPDVSCKR